MNQLQNIFHYNGARLRTIVKDGEPWFVARDVCDILEIGNASMALERLDDDEKGISLIETPGGKQKVGVVNEAGLYALVLGSRKQEARQFKRWVTHEVLPSIRKTGSYSVQPKSPGEMFLMIAEQLVASEKRMEVLEEKLEIANHRIDNMDKIDIIGNLQQRLNAMIRKHAANNGLTFRQSWHDFRAAYNTAYRTNITMLVENFKLKNGLRELSVPEYLAKTGCLEDAIRVADKMLNQKAV